MTVATNNDLTIGIATTCIDNITQTTDNLSDLLVSTTATPGYSYTIGSGFNGITAGPVYSNLYCDNSQCNAGMSHNWATYLKEEELKVIIDNLIERVEDKNVIKSFAKTVVRNCHLSEDFLISIFNYVSVYDIYEKHASDINSGLYPALKLLIENPVK